jgi:hypothetical protein
MSHIMQMAQQCTFIRRLRPTPAVEPVLAMTAE